jgi:hypothetical protein
MTAATLDCIRFSRVTCTIPDVFGDQATTKREPSNGQILNGSLRGFRRWLFLRAKH